MGRPGGATCHSLAPATSPNQEGSCGHNGAPAGPSCCPNSTACDQPPSESSLTRELQRSSGGVGAASCSAERSARSESSMSDSSEMITCSDGERSSSSSTPSSTRAGSCRSRAARAKPYDERFARTACWPYSRAKVSGLAHSECAVHLLVSPVTMAGCEKRRPSSCRSIPSRELRSMRWMSQVDAPSAPQGVGRNGRALPVATARRCAMQARSQLCERQPG